MRLRLVSQGVGILCFRCGWLGDNKTTERTVRSIWFNRSQRVLRFRTANSQTERKADECRSDDGRVLEAYGRDLKSNTGEQLLSFATNFKLALTNTFFSRRKGGMSHTRTGTRPNVRKRI